MPLPRDLLDLVLVPADPDLQPAVDALATLLDGWVDEGLLATGHRPLRYGPGRRADELLPGGFSTLWVDLPGRLTLYANQLGGVRVSCHACGRPLARELGQAVERWRTGGDPTVCCPGCGHGDHVAALPLRPPGAFGRVALVFADAGGVDPAPGLAARVRSVLGDVRVVLRRRS